MFLIFLNHNQTMLKLIQTSEGFNTHLLLVMYLRQYALLDSYRLR